MSTPKFAIGEIIILVAADFPQHEGEQQVKDILEPGDIYLDRFAKQYLKTMPIGVCSPYGYRMEEPIMDVDGYEVIFDERCLRKKHQPGELSFEELVNEQKQPASV